METGPDTYQQVVEICKQVSYGRIEILKEADKVTVIKKTETILPRK